MKVFKVVIIALSILLLGLYLSFLFVLPNVLEPSKYKGQVDKIVSSQTDLKIESKNIKLVTYWNLQIKLLLEDVVVSYPNKKKLLSSNKVEAGIKLLPLLIKKVELAPIKFNDVVLNIRIEKDGRYDIEKILVNKQDKAPSQMQNRFKLSGNLPQIIFYDYKIKLKDLSTKDTLIAKGKELKLSPFEANKRARITTIGDVQLNGEHCGNYDLNVDTILQFNDNGENKNSDIGLFSYNPIPILKKYGIKMNFSSDLKVTQKDSLLGAKGKLDIKKLSYNLDGKTIKDSFAKLIFDGNKVDIDANLYISKTDKLVVKGILNLGKNQYVDIKVVSNKIPLATLQSLVVALDDVLNIKSNISQLKLSGLLDADFNLRSDMKKLKSSGYLRISNASVAHKNLPLKISSINSSLTFDNNKITIRKAAALVNNAKFNANGVIDENAFVNINFASDELPFSLLYTAFAPAQLREELGIKSGKLKIEGSLKGKINKLVPKVSVALNGIKVFQHKTNISSNIQSANLELKTDKNNQLQGRAILHDISGYINELKSNYKSQEISCDFDSKNLKILPYKLLLGNSQLSLSGSVNDYATNPNAVINVDGKYFAKDAIKLVPFEYRSFVQAKGALPLFGKITANSKTTKAHFQIFADANNHFSVLNINNLIGHNTVTNVDVETDGKFLRISDFTLYKQNKKQAFLHNFNDNLSNTLKISSITGKIIGLQKKEYVFSNLKIVSPTKLVATVPNMSGSNVEFKTDLVLNGNINTLDIKGLVLINEILLPQYKISGKNLQVDFAKDITAKARILNVNGSQLAFDALIDKNISKNILIKNLNVNSTFTDVQKLIKALSDLPQSSVSPNGKIPVIIQKAHAVMAKVKIDKLYAQNAVCDFSLNNNILKITSLRADMYNGIVIGTVDYNLVYETLKTKLQGRNLSAKPTFDAIIGLNDQLNGKLNFDTELTMLFGADSIYKKTLRGMVNFSIADGQMGTLGRLEHFIHASNLLSQRFMKSNLNSIVQSIAPQNTGSFKIMKGHIVLENGWAKIEPMYSSGAQMSLYVTGRFNMLNNYAKLEILGRVAKEIVSVMGPLGDISLRKIIDSVNQTPTARLDLLESYKALKDEALVTKVPQLITQNPNTRLFRTVIDGEITKPTSVRTFKWLASESDIREAKSNIRTQMSTSTVSQPEPQKNINTFVERQYPQEKTVPVSEKEQQKVPISTPSIEPVERPTQNQTSMPSFWDKID